MALGKHTVSETEQAFRSRVCVTFFMLEKNPASIEELVWQRQMGVSGHFSLCPLKWAALLY